MIRGSAEGQFLLWWSRRQMGLLQMSSVCARWQIAARWEEQSRELQSFRKRSGD